MAEQGTAAMAADDELSRAWDDEVKGSNGGQDKAGEEAIPPETPPASAEPSEAELDHKESSKLGRKFKGLEDRFDKLMARLESMSVPQKETREIPSVPEPDEPEVVSTPDDVRSVLKADERRKLEAQRSYETGYLQQLEHLKGREEDESLYEEVLAEMTNVKSPFNVRHSNDPGADARINFAEAKLHIMKVRFEKGIPHVPKRDGSIKSPVQPAAGLSRETSRPVVLPKVDKFAQDYVDYLRSQNVSEKEIAEALEK